MKVYFKILATTLLAVASVEYVPAQTVFTGTDLGSPTLHGSATTNTDGTLSIVGGGDDIWNYGDNCYFYYTSVTGQVWDAVIRVRDLTGTSSTWAKCELMARGADGEALPNTADPFIAAITTPASGQNEITVQFRSQRAGFAGWVDNYPPSRPSYPNQWMRLQRLGSVFNVFFGADGTNWTQYISIDSANSETLGSVGGFPSTVFGTVFSDPLWLGVAVTAHNDSDPAGATATVSDLQVTLGPGQLAIEDPIGLPTGFNLTVGNNGVAIVNAASAQVTLDGTPVTTTTTNFAGGATLTYDLSSAPLITGSIHTVGILVLDTTGHTNTATKTFVVPAYTQVPTSAAVAPATVDTTKPGFKLRIHQVSTPQPVTNSRTELELAGFLGENIADTSAYVNGYYHEPGVINYSIDALSFEVGDFAGDALFPGIPADNFTNPPPTENFAMEVLTVLYFPSAGAYRMVVNSDDGFRTTPFVPGEDVTDAANQAGEFDGGRPPQDTGFWLYIEQPGYYGFRTIYNQGCCGAAIEWMTRSAAGKKVLINSSDPTAITAYAKADVIKTRPYFESALPVGEGVDPSNNTADIVLVDSDTTVNTGTIVLTYDAVVVTPTVSFNTPALGKTKVTYNLGSLTRNTVHTLAISFQDSDGVLVQKSWTFSVAGQVVRRFFNNGGAGIPGTAVADLTGSPQFQANAPDAVELVDTIEQPASPDRGVNYGEDFLGFFQPQVTANYTFYIASDDNSQFFLSTDDTLSNATQICEVTVWDNFREYLTSAGGSSLAVGPNGKQSAPIPLVAGNTYFFHALMKQGGGGDHISVTWWYPGLPPVQNGDPPHSLGLVAFTGVQAAVTPASASILQGYQVQFTGQAVAIQGAISYQWQFNGVNLTDGGRISGATSSVLTIAQAQPADAGNYRLVASNVAGSANSPDAVLTVTPVTANVYTATTTADDGSPGSLRQLIIAANAHPGVDTIILPAGTYALTIVGAGEDAAATGDLDITDDLTIIGAGAGSTIIDGSVLGDRVFQIIGASVKVTMSWLTIQGGQVSGGLGGGILSSGNLALQGCVVTNCNTGAGGSGLGGGIYASGILTLQGTTVASNVTAGSGGGIYFSGATLALTDSTIAGNSDQTDSGAMVLQNGSAALTRTRVAGNSSSQGCGGISVGASASLTMDSCEVSANQGGGLASRFTGGGMENYGSVGLTNCTFSGNSIQLMGGSAIFGSPGSTADALNCTFAANFVNSESAFAGGIMTTGAIFQARNSLFAGNTGNGTPADFLGVLTSGGHNLLQSPSQTTIVGNLAGNLLNADPLLGPLQDNGGRTLTQDLLAGSPAINAGDNNDVPATDQRGLPRIYGGIVDIGAVEAQTVLDNTTWPKADSLTLAPSGTPNVSSATFQQVLATSGESRWFKFTAAPDSKLTVILSQLPADYNLFLFTDIAAAYQQLLQPTPDDLLQLGAESAPTAFSPTAFSEDAYAPTAFSPTAFSPTAFSPTAFSPTAFSPTASSPTAFSPTAFSPTAFSPTAFSPTAFSPTAFSPSVSPTAFSGAAISPTAFSPTAFSGAQTRSLIGISAFPGTADEGIFLNTWDNSGNFYICVQGRNGAFDPSNPFRLDLFITPGGCGTVSGQLPPSTTLAQSGGYHTLIITDVTRMNPANDPLTALALAAMQVKLLDFAGQPEVAGVIVDVGSDAAVSFANQQADSNISCIYAKNLVANAIKDIIALYRAANPDMEYVVLVGADSVIPFFRHPDTSTIGNESDYIPPVIDNSASQASLRLNQVLSQDDYGSLCGLSIHGSTFPIPDLAVGRLIETPAEILALLKAYLASNQGLLPTPVSSLVTGYSFMQPPATQIEGILEAGMSSGSTHDTLIAPQDLSPQLPGNWTSLDLRNALVNTRHDVVFLGGHFSCASALAADGDVTKQLTSFEISGSPADFSNALVVGAGCHVGYSVADADTVPLVQIDPEWVNAFLQHQAAAVIGGTGYQYGDTDFVAYSDKLYVELFQQLLYGSGPVAIAKALVSAKRQYLIDTAAPRGTDEKSLLETALYGLPMWRINLPSGRGGSPPPIPPAAPSLTAYSSNPGLVLGLDFADIDVNGMTFEEQSVIGNVYNPDGTTTPLTATYLTLTGNPGLSSNPGEPVLPLMTLDVSAAGTVLRGVGFRSGNYTDVNNVVQLSGAPATETRGVSVPLKTEVFFPTQPWSINYYDALCSLGGNRTLLMLTPVQYESDPVDQTMGTRRAFGAMSFRLFYSANTQAYGQNVPALAAAPSISGVQAQINGSTISLSVHAVGDPSAGMQSVWVTYADATVSPGQWQSLDLTQDLTDTTLWVGTLPVASPQNIRFMVQAVNGVGLVTLDANGGRYYEPVSGPPALTTLTLDNIPLMVPYATTAQLGAVLTSSGVPVAGQMVTFGLGQLRVSAQTDLSGHATTSLLLLTTPDNYPLQTTFAGTAALAPSSANATFTVQKLATTIELRELSPAPNLNVGATLTDATGSPLNEKGIFFLLTDASGTILYVRQTSTDPTGQAALGAVPVSPGTYEVQVYFDGTIPLGGSLAAPTSTTTISDDRYDPANALLQVTYIGQGCTVAYQGDTTAVALDTVHFAAKVTALDPSVNDLSLASVRYTVTRDSDGSMAAGVAASVGPDGLSFAPLAGLSAGAYHITLSVISGSFFVPAGSAAAPVALTVSQRPPETGPSAFGTTLNTSASVRVLKLLANDVDLTGNPLTLTSVDGTSAFGGTVTLSADGQFVNYTPAAGFQGLDSFHYTVSDGQGGVATATVTVVIQDTSLGSSPNIVSIQGSGTGVTITFIGVPGRNYGIQYADSLSPPDWQPLGAGRATAGPNGIYQVFDPSPGVARYYRAVLP